MTDTIKKIDSQDIKFLHSIKLDCEQQIAKAKLEMQNANLVFQNYVLQLKVKYGLSDRQDFNLETGEIKERE